MYPAVVVLVAALVGALVAVLVMRARSQRALDQRAAPARPGGRTTSPIRRAMRRTTATCARTILDVMEEGVLLLAADGAPLSRTTLSQAILGRVPDSAEALLPARAAACVRRAIATGEVERTRGRDRLADAVASGHRAARSGSDGTVLLVVRDITQARQLLATRRDFVANASHELKTPVASIRAAAETLRDGAIDDPPAALGSPSSSSESRSVCRGSSPTCSICHGSNRAASSATTST